MTLPEGDFLKSMGLLGGSTNMELMFVGTGGKFANRSITGSKLSVLHHQTFYTRVNIVQLKGTHGCCSINRYIETPFLYGVGVLSLSIDFVFGWPCKIDYLSMRYWLDIYLADRIFVVCVTILVKLWTIYCLSAVMLGRSEKLFSVGAIPLGDLLDGYNGNELFYAKSTLLTNGFTAVFLQP